MHRWHSLSAIDGFIKHLKWVILLTKVGVLQMALRAKQPVSNGKPRLKTLLYAGAGTGKTHFCCSFPDTYYIDSEGVEDYPHFVEMIRSNRGDLVYLTELTEIIAEVKELLSTKHNYKTLIIDSISFPTGWLSQMEAERLQKKSRGESEGTDYGANLAKGKRLTYQLGILLSMLDMNVIVTSHEKVRYIDGKEVGTIFDINDKMAYSLGSTWNMKLQGKNRRLYVEKSRYPELKTGESIDFNDGYETIKKIFGEEIFTRESKSVEIATAEQLEKFKRLTTLLGTTDETVQQWLRTVKSPTLESLSKETLQKWIDKLNSQVQNEAS